MADDEFLRDFLSGLYHQVPYLIAYAIGIFFAFLNWRRYPTPSLFVFLACAMKITAALAFPLSAALLLRRAEFRTFEAVTVLATLFDASAYGLLLFAVYSGRAVFGPPPERWPAPESPPPPSPSNKETGIHERK